MKKDRPRFPSSFAGRRSEEGDEGKEADGRGQTSRKVSLDDARLPKPSAPPIPEYVRANVDHHGSIWRVASLIAEPPLAVLEAETADGTVQFVLRAHEARHIHDLLGLLLTKLMTGRAH